MARECFACHGGFSESETCAVLTTSRFSQPCNKAFWSNILNTSKMSSKCKFHNPDGNEKIFGVNARSGKERNY